MIKLYLKLRPRQRLRHKNKATTKTKTEDKYKAMPKTMSKIENKDTLDNINKRIDMINKLYNGPKKVNAKVTKKIKQIYEGMCELQDEIYSDNSLLRLGELEKIDAIIDEALNVVWNTICRENRIRTEEIKIDKHKDIDGHDNKTELVNRIGGEIDNVMSEIRNETDKIDEKIHKVSEMHNDTLHMISDKLTEIMKKSMKNLRKIVV